jgi:DHA2 family multidrug resistance protein
MGFFDGLVSGTFLCPLIGGYLTEHVHWRAIFYINIPVGLLSVVAAFLLPRRSADQEKTFDWLGFASMTAAVTALLIALSQGHEEAGAADTSSLSLAPPQYYFASSY